MWVEIRAHEENTHIHTKKVYVEVGTDLLQANNLTNRYNM